MIGELVPSDVDDLLEALSEFTTAESSSPAAGSVTRGAALEIGK